LLNTVIYDPEGTHQYDAWMQCARLKVAPGGTDERYGLIALEGAWTHAPATAPVATATATAQRSAVSQRV
jgi:hypothetical protein